MAKPKPVEQMLLDQIAALSKQIAEIKAQQSTPQPAHKESKKGQPRPDVYYVLAGIPSQGLPPQAIACARILATAADVNHITEAEAMKLMDDGKAAGYLRTDQEAWRIFQYYRARLIAGNYLRMLNA